jgi:hypothetical protein
MVGNGCEFRGKGYQELLVGLLAIFMLMLT